MTDRDRLIKSLDGADLFLRNRATPTDAPLNEYDMEIMRNIAKTCDEAARVLEKAIIPPCKVGDKIYQTDGVRIYESTISEITFTTHKMICVTENIAFDERAIGKTVFLTKEEAEEKLKELGK